jgi:hypothetical protein
VISGAWGFLFVFLFINIGNEEIFPGKRGKVEEKAKAKEKKQNGKTIWGKTIKNKICAGNS